MNFKINNINFNAKYNVWGKQTSDETNDVYHNKIMKLEEQGLVATLGQEYMETPKVQSYLPYLPEDTFVRLHTGVIDREGQREDEILNFKPFLSFETKSINEQINIRKQLGAHADTLELSLNGLGGLDEKKIDNWFENLIEFYCHQK